MKEITVVELNRIANYPPTQNLIKVLLSKGYKVHFIGNCIEEIADTIKENNLFMGLDVALYHNKNSEMSTLKNNQFRIKAS